MFDLLVYLIRNRERVVSKDDLLASIWHGRIVSESAMNTRISAARLAIGDNGEDQRLIKTFARKGLRFLGAVQECDHDAAAKPYPTAEAPHHDTAAPGAATAIQTPRSFLGGHAPSSRQGSQEAATGRGIWRRIPLAFRSRKRRMWGVTSIALLGIAAIAAYLIAPPPGLVAKLPDVRLVTASPPPPKPHPGFQDCAICPDMVALPAGEFMMGAAKDDDDRAQFEGPPRRVVIARPFAIGRFEVTVDQFGAFVEQTATAVSRPDNPCRVDIGYDTPHWVGSPDASFRRPGFEASGAHPASCINWFDAQAYVAWLSRRTGKPYRLPTEAEWEYAARAGTTTRFSFGNDERLLCDHARFADLATRYAWRDSCRSDTAADGPLQVGRLKPNAWGLFDMSGNVAEWVEDCWTPDWTEIPTDGSAYMRPGTCEMGLTRGGGWLSNSRRLRTAYRSKAPAHLRAQVIGVRVALTLSAP